MTLLLEKLLNNPMEVYQSPHFNYRPAGTTISLLVIHSTANSTLSGLTSWFMNPDSKVSCHYGIGKDGTIANYVTEDLRAWHCGDSYWKGRSGCNDFSIGIELVNLNDGVDEYPTSQIVSALSLANKIRARYDLAIHDIVGHYDISPGRKTDPLGFDMDQFRYYLAKYKYENGG